MEWEIVGTGCTDAVVRRSTDGRTYAKTGISPSSVQELAAERDRISWLSTTGIPCARVLGWDGSTLVTTTVRGAPVSALPASLSSRVVPVLASALADLHLLPASSCPFDRSLAVTIPAARDRVAAGLVDEADFDLERTGWAAASVLASVESSITAMAAAEAGDLVVVHGDACLPNVLVDPSTLRLASWVDLGRLGVADRHWDLALTTRSLAAPDLNPAFGPGHAEALLAAYPTVADPARLAFYRLLDELA